MLGAKKLADITSPQWNSADRFARFQGINTQLKVKRKSNFTTLNNSLQHQIIFKKFQVNIIKIKLKSAQKLLNEL